MVADAFDAAARTVLGDSVPEDERKVWMAAVMELSGIFIEREEHSRGSSVSQGCKRQNISESASKTSL